MYFFPSVIFIIQYQDRKERTYATIKSAGGKRSILKTRGTMAQEVGAMYEAVNTTVERKKIRPFLYTDWWHFNSSLQISLYWLKL